MFDVMGPPCSPREVLGPDPLSVLCLTQFLKHKHAVQTAYCGDPSVASSCPLEQLKTHVDCKNAKSYVHFRWYSNSIIDELKQQLGSPSELRQSPSAIGCINIQHWNKKQPKSSDSLPQSSKELVELDLEIEKVLSTFQVVHPEKDAIQLETLRRPDRSRILTWKCVDDMIWTTSATLGLLPLDVIKQQRNVPFPLELARSDKSWSSCTCKSDRGFAPKTPTPLAAPVSRSQHCFVHARVLPEHMRPAYDAMLVWARNSGQACDYHMSQTSDLQQSTLDSSRLMPSVSHCAVKSDPDSSSSVVISTSASFDINQSSFPMAIKCFHASIDSGANAPDLEIENVFQALCSAPADSCQAMGLFVSIGSNSSDETVLVTHCINSIQTVLRNVFSQPRSRLLPRVFVALRIRGTFSWTDCDARYVYSLVKICLHIVFVILIDQRLLIFHHSTLQAKDLEKSTFVIIVTFAVD